MAHVAATCANGFVGDIEAADLALCIWTLALALCLAALVSFFGRLHQPLSSICHVHLCRKLLHVLVAGLVAGFVAESAIDSSWLQVYRDAPEPFSSNCQLFS